MYFLYEELHRVGSSEIFCILFAITMWTISCQLHHIQQCIYAFETIVLFVKSAWLFYISYLRFILSVGLQKLIVRAICKRRFTFVLLEDYNNLSTLPFLWTVVRPRHINTLKTDFFLLQGLTGYRTPEINGRSR